MKYTLTAKVSVGFLALYEATLTLTLSDGDWLVEASVADSATGLVAHSFEKTTLYNAGTPTAEGMAQLDAIKWLREQVAGKHDIQWHAVALGNRQWETVTS